MKKGVMLLMVTMLYFGCSVSKNETNSYPSKQLKTLIESKSFEIECEWAQPQITRAMYQIQNLGLLPQGSTMSNIHISGSSNYFRIKEDSVSAYLPYYGEQRFGGAYNDKAIAVAFEGVPEDLTVLKGKKGAYSIRFSIRAKFYRSERYRVHIKVFNNLSSTITIISSHRTTIVYDGVAKASTNTSELVSN